MSDLTVRARGLLDFAIQSVEEGLADPAQASECFSEAEHALRICRQDAREGRPIPSRSTCAHRHIRHLFDARPRRCACRTGALAEEGVG